MAITRRKFLGMSAIAGASLMLPWRFGAQEAFAAQAVSPILNKWVGGLRGLGPTGIPVALGVPDPVFPNTLMYDITIGEFTDTLHPNLPATTLWGYWDSRPTLADGITPNPSYNVKRHLGGLIIAQRGTASRLRIKNTLPANHILPNDTTIPGANLGANRAAVHLHGGAVPWISDGGPFHSFGPDADPRNAAGNYGLSFMTGTGSVFDNIPTSPMTAGQSDYFYPNDQSTRLMWYHDHAFGITRLNAYAGIATGYAILDPDQETALGTMVPPLTSLIPLVFQDKKFVNAATIAAQDPTWSTVMALRPDVQTTGSLWYAHIYDPKEFKLLTGKGLTPPPNPSAIPEFFGDTMLVNGTVAPLLNVEAKRYRFMALNACNARFLNINLLEVPAGAVEITTNPKTLLPIDPITGLPPAAGPSIIQIGTEGGYLERPVTHTNNKFFNPLTFTGNMLLGCAERSDFIIDFTGLAGKTFIMYNDAPGPFPAGPPTTDYFVGNKANPAMAGVIAGQTIDTRNILKIQVVANTGPQDSQNGFAFPQGFPRDPFIVPYPANAGPATPLTPPAAGQNVVYRDLTLNEDFDLNGRLRQLIGTQTLVMGKNKKLAYGLDYLQPATETPVAGNTEVWRIWNLTADTHPMHFHLVDVQILSRQAFTLVNGAFTPTPGTLRGPELDELGWKETAKCHPGEVITVCMKFDMPAVPFNVPFSTRPMGAAAAQIANANEYVWHCHILEHEEHDMMRPLVVTGQNPVTPISVTPATQSAAAGAAVPVTFAYLVKDSVGYTVTSSDQVNYPVTLAGLGFQVTVPTNAAAATVNFTVADNTGRAVATATLVIA